MQALQFLMQEYRRLCPIDPSMDGRPEQGQTFWQPALQHVLPDAIKIRVKRICFRIRIRIRRWFPQLMHCTPARPPPLPIRQAIHRDQRRHKQPPLNEHQPPSCRVPPQPAIRKNREHNRHTNEPPYSSPTVCEGVILPRASKSRNSDVVITS